MSGMWESGKTFAPWTPEQVEALNRYQTESGWHPFTCGNDRQWLKRRYDACPRDD